MENEKKEKEILTSENFIEKAQQVEINRMNLYDEAVKTGDPEIIMKAQSWIEHGEVKNITGAKIKSLLVDPMDFMVSFGYKEKPTRLTYHLLRNMSKTPLTAATINTRINQVSKFCEPQPDEYSVGFKIRLKDRNKKPSKEELRRIDELTQYFLDGGWGGYRWGRDDFDTFICKIARDSLTFDQFTFEILEDRKGLPQEFIATDASTYRIAYPDERSAPPKVDPLTGQKTMPYFVQIYQGEIDTEFYPWELAFGIRRPRTDLELNGYGYAELEELVNIVTGMLWSDEYNRRFFKQGSAPKGILRVSGNIAETKLKEFKRQWHQQMSGVYNSWKTPIIEADKMDWQNLMVTNKDMEFSQWQEYLIKLHSALFLIDPSEIGFDISRSAGSSPMFESNNEQRIKYSRDKGLVPILKNIQKRLNRNLLWRIDDRFELVFVGADAITEDIALDRAIKELSNFKTIDEIRAKFDLKELGDEQGGDNILNPNWMNWKNNKNMMEQQEQGEEGGGFDPSQGYEGEEDEVEQAINNNPFLEDFKDFVKGIKP